MITTVPLTASKLASTPALLLLNALPISCSASPPCGCWFERGYVETSPWDDDLTAELLTACVENTELRLHLAEAQDQCVELAIDAGELHAEIEALRARLAEAERDRDAWRAEAEGAQGRAVARG